MRPHICERCLSLVEMGVARCECGEFNFDFLGEKFNSDRIIDIAEIPFEVVEPLLTENNFGRKCDVTHQETQYRVRINKKHKLFKEQRHCSMCNRVAVKCLLVKLSYSGSKKDKNFYTVLVSSDDYSVFTEDHILARARGGADDDENKQTACWNCNCVKSLSEMRM